MKYLIHLVLVLFFLSCPGLRAVFAEDDYEEDNSASQARVIVINDTTAQSHDLHNQDDQDWIQFYGLDSTTYQVEVTNTGLGVDPAVELYDQDGTTLLASSDGSGPGGEETLLWPCPKEGIYFVKIGHVTTSSYGSESGYHLELITPDLLSFPGFLTGKIHSGSAAPVAGARIKAIHSTTGTRGSGISLPNGLFTVRLEEGSCSVIVQANGFSSTTVSATVPGSITIELNTIPMARADQVETTRGGMVSGNVLDNDLDGDGDPLSAVLDSGVRHGTLSLGSDGRFTYIHNGGNDVSDSFTYHVHDGRANSGTVTVTIIIQKVHLPFLHILMNDTDSTP